MAEAALFHGEVKQIDTRKPICSYQTLWGLFQAAVALQKGAQGASVLERIKLAARVANAMGRHAAGI